MFTINRLALDVVALLFPELCNACGTHLYYGEKEICIKCLRDLPFTDQYTDCLLRLPLFYDLTENEQAYILDQIKLFFKK